MGPRCLAIADYAPASHDPNAICDTKDLIEIMADDQERQPLPFQSENRVFDSLCLSDPERCRGLVRFPPEATEAIADEQYVRNVVEILFQPQSTS